MIEGTKYSRDFTVKNAGTDTLHLRGIRTSCGCTLAKVSSNTVVPGDSAVLHIVLDTKNFVDGPSSKHIFFETDDPAMAKVNITMNMVIQSVIQFSPSFVNFKNIVAGEVSERTQYIKNNTDTAVTVEILNIKDSRITTNFKRTTIAPGDSVGFTVTMRGTKKQDSPGENVLGQLEFRTDFPQKSLLELSYLGYVRKQ